jgi:hypothetical protein
VLQANLEKASSCRCARDLQAGPVREDGGEVIEPTQRRDVEPYADRGSRWRHGLVSRA